MGEDPSGYPYGKLEFDPNYEFWEPVTFLAALASTTKRIRLSTAVIVSPLRPAVFLAKQLSTLDHLSMGRLDIGLGAGWQKAEYDAAGAGKPVRADGGAGPGLQGLVDARSRDIFHGKYISFGAHSSTSVPGAIQRCSHLVGSERFRDAACARGGCRRWLVPTFFDYERLQIAIAKTGQYVPATRARFIQTPVIRIFQQGKNGPDLDASLAEYAKYKKIGGDHHGACASGLLPRHGRTRRLLARC